MLGGLFGDDWNDPRSMAALQLGAGLMAAGGPSRNPTNLGMALLGGLNQYQGVMDSAKRQKLLDEEMGLRREDSTMRRERFNAEIADARRKQQEQEARKAQLEELVSSVPEPMRPWARLFPEEAFKAMTKERENPFSKIDPANYTPESLAQFTQTGDYTQLRRRPQIQNVNNVAVDFDQVRPGQLLPQDPNKPFMAGPNGPVPNVPYQQYAQQTARAGASQTNVLMDNLGLKPKDRFDMEGKLRDDYTARTKLDRKVFGDAQDIAALVQSPSPLKDQSAIYKFAKMLDPEGAVREADYAAIASSVGGVEYVKSLVNRALTGERLTDKQRSDMAIVAQKFVDTAASRLSAANSEFSNIAPQYNLDPAKIISPVQRAGNGWKAYGYNSREEAVKDAKNTMIRNPNAKSEVIRRLEEMGITDHGLAR